MTGPLHAAAVAVAVAAILAAGPGAALAQDAGAVRTGDYPGFGRVVFEFNEPTKFNLAVSGDRVIVVFEGAPVVGSSGAPPRNVRNIQGGQGAATLLLMPGARARPAAMGNRVVIDVLDPPRALRAQAGRAAPFRPAPAGGAATAPDAAPALPVTRGALPDLPFARAVPALMAQGAPKAVQTPGQDAAAMAVPERLSAAGQPAAGTATPAPPPDRPGRMAPERMAQAPETAGSAPAATAAHPAGAPGGAAAPGLPSVPAQPVSTLPVSRLTSMLIPVEAGIGAAALRRGDTVLIVFDGPAEVDEARLRRLAGFTGATVQAGLAATVLQVPLPSGAIVLTREVRGWRISPAPAAGPATGDAPVAVPVAVAQAGADVMFKLLQPGRVVAVTDPATGGALLVGTASPAAGPAAGLPAGVTAPGAAILPTWAGVAVEPFSDDVALRATSGGFLLAAAGASAAEASAVGVAPAAALTRRFDFPNQPVPALMERLRAATAAAASAAPRARTPGRVAAAQAMLALGLAAEAQSVLSLVATDDPAPPPDVAGLAAIAGLLAGRVDAAGGLDAAALDGSDEVALWRGVRDAMLGRSEQAARVLPGLMPLALAYPAPLRDRVLPIVAETAVLADPAGGASLPDLPRLGFARALQLERRGRTEEALAAYDLLAAGQDQLDQVRAGANATELRLATGRIAPAQAAAAMARLVATWRGDAREAATRMRAAELHGKAGEWRPALDLLRETAALFPDAQPAIRARMASVFGAFLAGADAVPALDVITLAADYADCVPAGADLAGLLADKLLDLDLPARARAVLEPRVASSPRGAVRSGLGHRLAALQFEAGDADAAGRTLAATDTAGLPERLAAERTLLRAKVRAARGDPAGAAADLAAAGTLAAADLRARLLEQAGDWRRALAALDDLAGRLVPLDGPVPDGLTELVLRQASAAVQVGDGAALRVLGQRYAARLTGPRADLFRLLTAAPVGGVGDLARTGREIAFARAATGSAR